MTPGASGVASLQAESITTIEADEIISSKQRAVVGANLLVPFDYLSVGSRKGVGEKKTTNRIASLD
jgi:hypothetical protein